MKKRCWKSVLSAILAAAMLITSAPANLSMTVQAEELGVEDTLINTTAVEDETEQETEDQTGDGAGENQDVQNPAGDGAKVENPADDGEENDVTDDSDETSDSEATESLTDNVEPKVDEANTEAEAGAVANGKEITFTCKPADGFFGSWDATNEADVPLALSEVKDIKVHGQTMPDGKTWDTLAELTKGSDGVWTGTWTAPEYGTYTYQFQANNKAYYMLYNNKTNLTITLTDPDVEETYAGPTVDYNTASADPGAVTFYFPKTFKGDKVESVKVKGGWDASWEDKIPLVEGTNLWSVTLPTEKLARDKSVEYGFEVNADGEWSVDAANPNNGNSKLHRNPEIADSGDVTLFYYPSHGAYPTTVNLKYRKKDTTDYTTVEMKRPDSGETAVYQTTLSGLEEADFEYYFEVDGTKFEDTNNATIGEFSKVEIPDEDPSVKSPVTKDGKTTFYYYGPTAKTVKVAGNMTTPSWGDGARDMIYNAETGYWSIELELEPGTYEYKYIVGTQWIQDPLNPNPNGDNSIFTVAGLQVPTELWVKRGGSRTLPVTMKLDDGKQVTPAAVTYEVSAESQEKYGDKITLTTETKDNVTTTTLSVAADFPAADKSFTLTASAQGNSSDVTILVADATYMYTIYYYDPDPDHATVDSAALWLWQTSGGGANKQVDFDEVETLADGNVWLKKTIELGYTDVSLIPKAYGSWDWQDGEGKEYVNTEKKEEVTLYTVCDDSKIYTELPEIVAQKELYLVVEYTRTTGKVTDWSFYTWNSGYSGKKATIAFEDEDGDGIGIARIPVKQGRSSISFLLAQTDSMENKDWVKDGGDQVCPMPDDQNVVKIKMEEGKGITYTYPYNTGYEIDPKEGKINFYYRDDEAFLAGSEGGYEDVSLEMLVPKADTNIEAEAGEKETSKQTVKMEYDEEEQRYEYVLDQLVSGDHYYRYGRQKNADDAVEYVLDDFNELRETVDETEYSVLQYELLDVEMEAEIQNATMDYNDNNVLKINVSAKDLEGNPIEDTSEFKVVDRATVDLSALGGGVTEIDPELLALSIAVKQGTSAGEKTLPIAIYDVYNNEYTTEAKVTVVDRSKGSDFDWDEAVIYFAVTDRFFDGNSQNNDGGVAGSFDKTTNDGSNSSYHGGDFAGLTKKLDYLADLGVNTIWITPIVENQKTANDCSEDDAKKENKGVTEAWGYHGYWAKDFEKLDAHLGTEKEFQTLLDAAHAKGMKVMVDVVLNHSGYGNEITDYFDTNFKNEDGEVIKMLRGSDEVVTGSDQQSSLSGLPDFRTEDPEVRELLVEWQSNWVSKYPIDYYRVDTVKHVDGTTWSAFKNALTEIDPDFKMIGEWAGGGYTTDTGMLRSGRMDSLLDFDFNDQAAKFVTGDLSGAESFLSTRNAAIDNTASLGAFLSSHDEDGFVTTLIDKGTPAEEAHNLALVAASLQLTAKGQVVIYYGEEIGMSGYENYPYNTNRNDFDWSQTDANANNATLKHYKEMLKIRNMYSDLFAKGTRTTIAVDNAKGLDVFKRSFNGAELTVALNITSEPTTYTLATGKANTYLYDLYNKVYYAADADGNAEITIPAAADGGTVVLEERSGKGGYNVTFDYNYAGSVADVIEVEPGALLIGKMPADPTREGYEFVGWYKDQTCSKEWVIDTDTVQADTTLYALWMSRVVTERGDTADGEEAEVELFVQDIQPLTYTGSALKPAVAVFAKTTSSETGRTSLVQLKSGKDYKIAYKYNVNAYEGEVKTTTYKDAKAAKAWSSISSGAPYVQITAKGVYSGVICKEFKILKADINDAELKYNSQIVANNGNTKVVTSLKYKKALKEGTDFDVVVKDENGTDVANTEYNNGKFKKAATILKAKANAGIYMMTITAKEGSNYKGTVTDKTIIIADKAQLMQKATVTLGANIKKRPWTGEEITLTPAEQAGKEVFVVKLNGKILKYGEENDYTVSYRNNTDVGTATMIITGMGEYKGTKEVTFQITGTKFTATGKNATVKVSEDGKSALSDETYTGQPITKSDITLTTVAGRKSRDLALGRDYTMVYKNNLKKGTATITFTATPRSGYTGKFTMKFKITAAKLSDVITAIKGCSGTDEKSVYKYDGPAVPYDKSGAKLTGITLVRDNGVELKAGTDYTVSYKDNKNPATKATMTLKGKGNYDTKDTLTVSYDVAKVPDSALTITTAATQYNAKKADNFEYKPKVTVKYGKTTLKANTDYTVVGYNNNNQSDVREYLNGNVEKKPSVDIKINNTAYYEGTPAEAPINVPLNIYDKKMTNKNVTIEFADGDGPYYYEGGMPIRPQIKLITYKDSNGNVTELYDYDKSDAKLKDNKNFSIVWGANNKTGKTAGTVKITGIDQYGGSVTKKFQIVAKPIDRDIHQNLIVDAVTYDWYIDMLIRADLDEALATAGNRFEAKYDREKNTADVTITEAIKDRDIRKALDKWIELNDNTGNENRLEGLRQDAEARFKDDLKGAKRIDLKMDVKFDPVSLPWGSITLESYSKTKTIEDPSRYIKDKTTGELLQKVREKYATMYDEMLDKCEEKIGRKPEKFSDIPSGTITATATIVYEDGTRMKLTYTVKVTNEALSIAE